MSWPRCWARSGPGSPRTRSAPSAPGWRRPGPPCCSRARPSWSLEPGLGLGRGRSPRPRLDRPGRVGRHAGRNVCGAAGGGPVGRDGGGAGRLAPGVHGSRHPGAIPPTRMAELAAEELGRLQRRDAELTEEVRWTAMGVSGIDPATASADIDLGRVPGQYRDPARSGAARRGDGRGQGRRLRPRHAALCPRGPGGGRDLAGRGHPGRGAGAARGRRRAAGCSPGCTGSDEDLAPLVAADVDVSVQSIDQLSRLAAAAGTVERQARVHLKIDTGLSRNGHPRRGLARALCRGGGGRTVRARSRSCGIWSHFAAADEPGHRSVPVQFAAFEKAYAVVAGGRAGAGAAPSRQLRRRAAAAGGPAGPGPGRASPRTGSTRRPASPPWPAYASGR